MSADSSSTDGAGNDGTVGDSGNVGTDTGTTGSDSETGTDSSPGDSGAASDAGTLANMAVVDGGTFYFTVLSDGGYIDAQATLDYEVAIDRTEVTVATFTAWVNAGMPLPCGGGACSLDPNGPYATTMMWDPTWNAGITGTNDYTDAGNCGFSIATQPVITYGTRGDYPITCVNWPQAEAVCAWQGKRLPTETEWRFFVTGQGTRPLYPWGAAAPDCKHAITDLGGSACGFPVPVATADAGASRDGVFDLVGSMSEWEWDLVTAGQQYTYPQNAGTDYVGPTGAGTNGPQSRDWVGQDFSQGAGSQYFTTGWEGASSSSAWSGYDHCGFRCAVTVRYP